MASGEVINVLILGPKKSGKTELYRALTTNEKYNAEYRPTTATERKKIEIDSATYQYWDIGDEPRETAVAYRDANIVIFTVDPTALKASIADWDSCKRLIPESATIIFALTKSDTKQAKKFSENDFVKFLIRQGIDRAFVTRCSAKEGDIDVIKDILHSIGNKSPVKCRELLSYHEKISRIGKALKCLPAETKYQDKLHNHVVAFRCLAQKELNRLKNDKDVKKLKQLSKAVTKTFFIYDQATTKGPLTTQVIQDYKKLASHFNHSRLKPIMLGIAGLALAVVGAVMTGVATGGMLPSMGTVAPFFSVGLGLLCTGTVMLAASGPLFFNKPRARLSQAIKDIAADARHLQSSTR